MLARDYADHIQLKEKPVIISHHMLMGLKEGQQKMSKSDPDSAIFMEDSAEEVTRKINKKAFCPEKVIADNPILDYTKHIIFESFPTFLIKRKPEFGGDIVYNDYSTLEKDFEEGKLFPKDLKIAVAKEISKLLSKMNQEKLRKLAEKAY